MSVGSSSNEPDSSPRPADTGKLTAPQVLFTELSRIVTERFERLSGLVATLGPVDLTCSQPIEVLPMPPAHPLCSPTPDIDCCRESWRSHLADLALKLQVSSHKCRFGRLCAVVPVIWDQRCVAVCRLVCPQSMGEEAFEHHVELLAVLIENFVARHGAGLSADVLFTAKTTAQTPPSAGPTAARQGGPPLHAKVKSAAEYIDEHLRDIDLNAAQIARHLGINATYLAHLFVDQTGMRMNRYVAVQRVETAKRLLAVTDWQIKRIARESGYANPDWFGHVFHALTGMTPSDYRQKIRDSGPASTSE